MDQVKVGKFIAECRKKQNLTQIQLSEKLGITDRAVSKWETGKTMPDSSLMLELCDILNITVNDLLNGELVSSEEYNKKLEQQLLEMVKQKEHTDKSLLGMQVVLSIVSVILYLGSFAVALLGNLEIGLYLAIMSIALVVSVVIDIVAYRLAYKAGFYRCQRCGHTYIPPFKTIFFAFSFNGRNLYFPCENCQKPAWHKKVLTKE